jgi:hydroxyacylglutathione hydrolase
MILKRIYDDNLAHASYILGCAATGEALVVDANTDIDQYLEAAAAEGLTITAVTETHIHADYVSGSRELAHAASARLFLSDEGDENWKYAFAHEPNVTLLKNGDVIRIGRLKIEALHTPGHTPEHLSFVVTDTPASDAPVLAFTGDFLFVGDVGRPDLLERAAGYTGTMEKGASVLFHSLKRFAALPDHLQIWPAHGSGSACGKSLGGVPVSTLGYEKISNWALQIEDEAVFVQQVLAGQPEPPTYFARMKAVNKTGYALPTAAAAPLRVGATHARRLYDSGALIVDIRSSSEYLQRHLRGVLHIPSGRMLANWAGWLLPDDTPIYLLAADAEQVRSAVRSMRMVGINDVRGWFGPEVLQHKDLKDACTSVETVPAAHLHAHDGTSPLVDVRGALEWEGGHLPHATNITLGSLPSEVHRIPQDQPVTVMCQTGARSPIAVSVLERAGFQKVRNTSGGWRSIQSA